MKTSSAYFQPVTDEHLASIIRKYSFGSEHAKDLLQEARIKVWQTVQAHPDQRPYYYIKAAERRVMDLTIRRDPYFGAHARTDKGVQESLSAMHPADDATDKDEWAEPADERSEPSRVYSDAELLRAYPHFYLFQVDGLPIREVAATLGETFKVARNHLETERHLFALEYGRTT